MEYSVTQKLVDITAVRNSPTGHIKTAGVEHTALAIFVLGVLATSGVFFHALAGVPITFPVNGFSPGQSLATLSSRITNDAVPPAEPKEAAVTENKGSLIIPSHVFMNVPFTPQAPHAKWGPPWNEACEEASVLMAMDWVFGTSVASDPDMASAAIQNIIAFENKNFGYHNDTALRETAKIISRFYTYSGAEVIYDITIDDVRYELASGNLVILPLAGYLLRNPNFSTAPPYHMVVAVGYDDTAREFIVQEPGTRRGENYRYSYDTLTNTIHDWTGSNVTMTSGRTGMIVVHPVRD